MAKFKKLRCVAYVQAHNSHKKAFAVLLLYSEPPKLHASLSLASCNNLCTGWFTEHEKPAATNLCLQPKCTHSPQHTHIAIEVMWTYSFSMNAASNRNPDRLTCRPTSPPAARAALLPLTGKIAHALMLGCLAKGTPVASCCRWAHTFRHSHDTACQSLTMHVIYTSLTHPSAHSFTQSA